MRAIRKESSKRRGRRASTDRTGTAVVEFAVVAPLMILLTLGMMELGRVTMVQQMLINTSREGARMAVLPGMTKAEVESHVQDDLTALAIHGATVSVSPEALATAPAGTAVSVTITIPARDVSWVPNPVFTMDTTLHASTTMRRESQ